MSEEFVAVDISPEIRSNMERLAAYLEQQDGLKAEFDMSDYWVSDEEQNDSVCQGGDYRTDCGTIGCAVGHGPYAGVVKRECESWGSYHRRCFPPLTSAVGCFCFAASWHAVDNTALGAAKRIRTILDRGLPANWRQNNQPSVFDRILLGEEVPIAVI